MKKRNPKDPFWTFTKSLSEETSKLTPRQRASVSYVVPPEVEEAGVLAVFRRLLVETP